MFTIFLSPALRGSQDFIRVPLEKILHHSARLRIASQQVSDHQIVNCIATNIHGRYSSPHVLIESDYLYDREPVAPDLIWKQGGRREKHRQCFLALIRSGSKIRTDYVNGPLQHINLVLAEKKHTLGHCFLTSANFSPGSLQRHFNWGLSVRDPDAIGEISRQFTKAWDGDFRDVNLEYYCTDAEGQLAHIAMGAKGQACRSAEELIDSAQQKIRFAYFNISKTSRVTNALIRAARQGVDVAGIVDGDQQDASWDAVPDLRKAGVDARYYPGILTGAMGRMHYKMMTVDRKIHLATANASSASESSLELGLTLHVKINDSAALEYVRHEITRLFNNARVPGVLP
jgi:hypothetical protein